MGSFPDIDLSQTPGPICFGPMGEGGLLNEIVNFGATGIASSYPQGTANAAWIQGCPFLVEQRSYASKFTFTTPIDAAGPSTLTNNEIAIYTETGSQICTTGLFSISVPTVTDNNVDQAIASPTFLNPGMYYLVWALAAISGGFSPCKGTGALSNVGKVRALGLVTTGATNGGTALTASLTLSQNTVLAGIPTIGIWSL